MRAFIVDSVRKDLSRRGFIGAAITCAVAAPVPVRAHQKPVRLPNGFRDVVDLTHTFSPSLPVYPGYRPVGERDICVAGVDTLSLDAGAAQKFVAHLAILGAGKYGVELLANLGGVPPSGATIVIGAPKHMGGTGGPARVLALV